MKLQVLNFIQHRSCWIIYSNEGVSSGVSAGWNYSGCRSSTLWLLTQIYSPPFSVASSREHQKTNMMLRITRQRSMFSPLTKTNSLLRPESCSLSRGKRKNPMKARSSCEHGLINCLFQQQQQQLQCHKFKQTHIVLGLLKKVNTIVVQ